LAFDQELISSKAKAAIDDVRQNADGLAISDITLWELATLASKGRVRLDISLESFLQEVESRFVVLAITGRACARALALPASYPNESRQLYPARTRTRGVPVSRPNRRRKTRRSLLQFWATEQSSHNTEDAYHRAGSSWCQHGAVGRTRIDC
jgi:PIN domain nuclease of toxin-antitoxin system